MPDPTPKPISMLKGHRTKDELNYRKEQEKAMQTKKPMKEWAGVKANPTAHKYFVKIKSLLKSIDKDDALSETVINRYCQMLAECDQYEIYYKKINDTIAELEENRDSMEFKQYMQVLCELNKCLQNNDRLLQGKRKMLLDIEKESLMTISSQMRSIPKKPPEDEEEGGIAEMFRQRRI